MPKSPVPAPETPSRKEGGTDELLNIHTKATEPQPEEGPAEAEEQSRSISKERSSPAATANTEVNITIHIDSSRAEKKNATDHEKTRYLPDSSKITGDRETSPTDEREAEKSTSSSERHRPPTSLPNNRGALGHLPRIRTSEQVFEGNWPDLHFDSSGRRWYAVWNHNGFYAYRGIHTGIGNIGYKGILELNGGTIGGKLKFHRFDSLKDAVEGYSASKWLNKEATEGLEGNPDVYFW